MFRAGTQTNNMQKESTKKKGLRRVLLALGLVCALAAAVILIPNACVVLSTKGKILTLEDAAPEEADCILVLGCGVYSDGSPTPMLRDRLSRAVELYQAGWAGKQIGRASCRERV